MNNFQNIQSGAGLLKDVYDPGETPILDALRQRRRRSADKLLVPTKDDLEKNEGKENG